MPKRGPANWNRSDPQESTIYLVLRKFAPNLQAVKSQNKQFWIFFNSKLLTNLLTTNTTPDSRCIKALPNTWKVPSNLPIRLDWSFYLYLD